MTEPTPSPVGSEGRRIVGLVVALVAPTTLITALAYYFGYRREQAFAGYFGIDSSALGFSTSDYVLRSVDALFVPVAIVLLVAFGAVFLHALAGDRLVRVDVRPIAAVAGFGGMQEDRWCAGALESRGYLAAHVAGLAHAGDHYLSGVSQDQIHRVQ